MLMNVLKVLVYELFLEIFYEKMTKQLILLIGFNISHKNNIKTFKYSLLTFALRAHNHMAYIKLCLRK